MTRISWYLSIGICAAALACAQDEPPAQAPAVGGGGRGGFGGGAQAVPDPQPYDRVITKDAKTSKGLFTVHQIKERYFYEIPKKELSRELLWNSQIAKTTMGAGYGGGQYADRVVRWDLKGNRVLLLDVNYGMVARPDEPIAMAGKNANNDAIIMSFNGAAFSKEGDPGIEGGRGMVRRDAAEVRAGTRLGATAVDASRTFVEHVHAFPDNMEAEVTVTYTRGAGGAALATGGRGGGGLGGGQMRGNSATVVL